MKITKIAKTVVLSALLVGSVGAGGSQLSVEATESTSYGNPQIRQVDSDPVQIPTVEEIAKEEAPSELSGVKVTETAPEPIKTEAPKVTEAPKKSPEPKPETAPAEVKDSSESFSEPEVVEEVITTTTTTTTTVIEEPKSLPSQSPPRKHDEKADEKSVAPTRKESNDGVIFKDSVAGYLHDLNDVPCGGLYDYGRGFEDFYTREINCKGSQTYIDIQPGQKVSIDGEIYRMTNAQNLNYYNDTMDDVSWGADLYVQTCYPKDRGNVRIVAFEKVN